MDRGDPWMDGAMDGWMDPMTRRTRGRRSATHARAGETDGQTLTVVVGRLGVLCIESIVVIGPRSRDIGYHTYSVQRTQTNREDADEQRWG